MEMPSNRIQLAYGYIVCLIAVVTILISAHSIVNSIFERTRPSVIDEYGPFPSPSGSFEAYKLDRQSQAVSVKEKSGAPIIIPSDSALRRDYDEQRRQRKAMMAWQANKSLVTSIIMLILASVLFAWHWRWVRRISGEPMNG